MSSSKHRSDSRGKLEVHEHCVVSGPRTNSERLNQVNHSHDGGNSQHTHPGCGPACYTIDRDEWFAATGMRGGGRKRFTVKPLGEQLPVVQRALEPFQVVIVGDGGRAVAHGCEGPGVQPAARMAMRFRQGFTVHHEPARHGVAR